ncbi:MAG: hypothetical protein ACE3JP_01230 [Ectobacillus sp.]
MARLTNEEKTILEYKAMAEQQKTQQANQIIYHLQQKQLLSHIFQTKKER